MIFMVIHAGYRCPNPSESPIPCNAGYYTDATGSTVCQSVSTRTQKSITCYRRNSKYFYE